MKLALEKARKSYQLKYQEFILKIERDADEVNHKKVNCYELDI